MEANNIAELKNRYDIQVEWLKSILVKKKNEILYDYKDYNKFINRINYNLIEGSGNRNFPAFYDVYDKIFTIEEEKESYAGFEEVLDFNFNTSLQQKLGPFKEVILYCTAPDSNEIIGGINFATYLYPDLFEKYKSFGTSHLFYLFVKPEYRNLNLGTDLISKAESFSRTFLFNWMKKRHEKILFSDIQLMVFCEQNSPEKMTLSQYWTDNLNSLTDQCDRLKWWNKRGFRRLNMNYVQPALNMENDPCLYLSLNVKTGLNSVPSDILLEHIKRIFSISILKGRNIENDLNYKKITQYLRSRTFVSFSKIPDYELIKNSIYQFSTSENSTDTIIEDLLNK